MDTELLRKGLTEIQEACGELLNLFVDEKPKTGTRKKTTTKKKTEEPTVTKEDALESLRQVAKQSGDNAVIVQIMKDVAGVTKFPKIKDEKHFAEIVEASQAWLDDNPPEEEGDPLEG